MLPAIAAVVLVAGLLTHATVRGDLGWSARIHESQLELRIKLPVVCVRLQASLGGGLVASAHLLTCDAGCTRPHGKAWA
jgi:hypothetical protein